MSEHDTAKELCHYCGRPVDSQGAIFHRSDCAGLDTIKLSRLEYDALAAAAAEIERLRRKVSEQLSVIDSLNAQIANLSMTRRAGGEPESVRFAHCDFMGPPPTGYASWNEWAAQPVLRNAVLRANDEPAHGVSAPIDKAVNCFKSSDPMPKMETLCAECGKPFGMHLVVDQNGTFDICPARDP